jgi:hypothetical protein
MLPVQDWGMMQCLCRRTIALDDVVTCAVMLCRKYVDYQIVTASHSGCKPSYNLSPVLGHLPQNHKTA